MNKRMQQVIASVSLLATLLMSGSVAVPSVHLLAGGIPPNPIYTHVVTDVYPPHPSSIGNATVLPSRQQLAIQVGFNPQHP